MLMPASSEFVSLCRSQVALLTQGLGAASGAVYLTEESTTDLERNLIPIVVYPETIAPWHSNTPLRLPGDQRHFLLAAQSLPEVISPPLDADPEQNNSAADLVWQQRIVLPLIHEDLVLGLLVVGRDERPWQDWERNQLEEIAHTLAIACFLDQRYQWFGRTGDQQKLLQAQQHDTLSNLLHQFRNPLTTLRTLGKLLLKRLQPADKNRSIATSIVQESDRLQDLLLQFDQAIDLGEAALDAAKESSVVLHDLPRQISQAPARPLLPASGLGGGGMVLTPCSVAEVLAPLIQSARAIALERNLTLQTEIPQGLPVVQANPQALREVCSNLIDNAFKYTPARGKIWVQVSRLPTQIGQQIAISNTGPGIPPGDLAHLFERHYRGVQANSEIPGTGLGLAIARDLVTKMQGQIQVFSPALPSSLNLEPVGPGSTFTVTLPELPA